MKNKILTYSFVLIIFSFFLFNIFTKDIEISYTERKKLQMFPTPTLNNLLNGTWGDKFDFYSSEQFVYRDNFRFLKANIEYKVLRKYDNNGIYLLNNNIFKIEYPLKTNYVSNNINKINYVISNYLKNNNVYYSIIPDKNYYNNSNKYLKLDYEEMFQEINNNLNNCQYINLTPLLTLDDYYLTDPHWKQENLDKIVQTLITKIGLSYKNIDYKKNIYNNFYGSYYNQSALKLQPENLIYLENSYTKNAMVYDLESNKNISVYNQTKLDAIDPYDVFLDGAKAYIEITNTNSLSSKELIIFRDSFGSSITPLLIPYYQKITLIDLRYMDKSLLANYISFNKQDVLFLYSTLIYNSNSLK